jgi:hypothetical protein
MWTQGATLTTHLSLHHTQSSNPRLQHTRRHATSQGQHCCPNGHCTQKCCATAISSSYSSYCSRKCHAWAYDPAHSAAAGQCNEIFVVALTIKHAYATLCTYRKTTGLCEQQRCNMRPKEGMSVYTNWDASSPSLLVKQNTKPASTR